MGKSFGHKLFGVLLRLWHAQDARCFHCDTPMLLAEDAKQKNAMGWTREHVFPRRGLGRGMDNNIVLAHCSCNNERGNREPSADEIARAGRLYQRLGLTAFTPATTDDWKHAANRRTRRRAERRKRNTARVARMQMHHDSGGGS